jgi:hypothetical protein
MADYLKIAREALQHRQEPRQDEPGSLEAVLKGRAVELWSDQAGRLFLVSDEEDARRLGEPRGEVYTATEMCMVIQITDPETVLEIHGWKREFNARVQEFRGRDGTK